MTRKQICIALGAVVLAVVAPLLTLAVLRGLDGSARAAPPQTHTKVSMPDLGQHSHSWCWVAAAANSFRWYCENTPEGAEDGLCGGTGHPWLAIDPDSTNSTSTCGTGMSWYDYRDGAPAPNDGSAVLGYDTLLKKIAETTFKDANQNGIKDAGEDNYCYSEGVEKWDYLVGLRDYVAAYGADLWVHDIIDPARCNPPAPYYLANRVAPTASVRPACPPPVGVSQQVRPPTLQDYMYELSRGQDVLLWMDPVASLQSLYYQSEPYSHVVTGVGYDNTLGAGAYGLGVVTISDPWTSTTNAAGAAPVASAFHNDSLPAPWQGKPSHNTSGTHNATDPYNACDVALTNPFVIQCYNEDTGAPQLWQVVDMIFVSPTGSADIKVLDFWTESPYVYQESYPDIWTPIIATEVKHNNGPDSVVAYVEWWVTGANVPGGDPTAPNVRWRPSDTDDICTFQDAIVDCTTGVVAPGQPYDGDIDDIEFQVTLPVSEQVTLQRTLEVECKASGVWVLTLSNYEYPPEGIDDPDMTNNLRTTELTVFCAVTPTVADKNVSSIDVDISAVDNDPTDDDLDIVTSETVKITVTSNDENLSMNDADTLITFLANVAEDCEGQWLVDPTGGYVDWRHEYEKYDPQVPLDQAHGYEHRDGMVPGDGDTGSCGPTAESALHFEDSEESGSSHAYAREFQLHCSLDGTYSFHFCNKAEVLAPVIDTNMNNNWKCQYLDVTSAPPAQEVDLQKVDLYVKPFYCGDTDLDGLEDSGLAAGTIPGTGDCCDGVDNDGDTNTDGRDSDCVPYINEDDMDQSDDDLDDLIDEDPTTADVGCPFDGDDDCDGDIDEDPKNGVNDDDDDFTDEDPANGFLGIDNDRDGDVDEDGAGRFDWDGDTDIDEVQLEGVDDDGDTQVDEDPLDSPVREPSESAEIKWAQLPDMGTTGLDVNAVGQMDYTLANDFLCDESGYITQIDFWASWWDDLTPTGGAGSVSFDLSIHADIPENGEYSRPGALLWGYSTTVGECTATLYASGLAEGWLTPPEGYDPTGDTMIWLYSCLIPDGDQFEQEEGTIYWLDVTAYPASEAYFGWKSSETVWNDDSVYSYDGGPWYELLYPYGEPSHPWAGESFDLAFQIWGEPAALPLYEPHYLIKEVLRNLGTVSVLAEDTKELDAPYWRADAREDGLTTCNDGLNNDSGPCNDHIDNDRDGLTDLADSDCGGLPSGTEVDDLLIDANDPDCTAVHGGEEAPGLHSCRDGLDNGDGTEPGGGGAQVPGDDLIDEGDPDCQTFTEVSVECEYADDIITAKADVPWYIKPRSDDPVLSEHEECGQYYDTVHDNKCVPCKIPAADFYDYYQMSVPNLVTGQYCDSLVPYQPGYCIAVDSVEDVYKELDFHQEVLLPPGEDVVQEHQFDLSCEGEIGQHKFIIQNEIQPVEGTDPNQDNNELEMELLVECVPACSPGIDSDADKFDDNLECYVGTDPGDDCPDWAGTTGLCPGPSCNGDDAWPLDNDVDRTVSVTGDVFSYIGRVGAIPTSPNWMRRLDLDMDSTISVTGDVFMFIGKVGNICS